MKRWHYTLKPSSHHIHRRPFFQSYVAAPQPVHPCTHARIAAPQEGPRIPHATSAAQAVQESTAADAASTNAEQESLDILEWPAVCKQVAAFCGTSVAAAAVAAGQLPIGSSQAGSELLLQQTSEALAAELR